ncbi:related to bcp1 [Lecanosticta acicola]|uniref:Protein BCP1 n=1 Tax=Lecanosticta acicola TaxID=111012 RepID=A0AAI8YVT2_9PEZI|nr:related to bcp1 [Lecanosticta acicola]
MGKRKANGDAEIPSKDKMDVDGEDSGSEDDTDLLNVDFEWFDPQPAVDFHGLKTLLRQLFDVDNQLFDLSELADMILAQPLLGSTVKCDGNESDPYAFLTVLNLHQHRQKKVIQQLTEYLLNRTKPQQALHQHLQTLLSPDAASAQIGLILTERFINVPHQIVPPMYNMLQEEIQWALEENEPYHFSHYLVISKTYSEVASKLDAEENPPSKKKKAADSLAETFYFHPEDEVLQKHALGYGNFEYERQGDEGASDAKRTFSELGVKPQGHLILLEGKNFADAVKAVGEYLSGE